MINPLSVIAMEYTKIVYYGSLSQEWLLTYRRKKTLWCNAIAYQTKLKKDEKVFVNDNEN